MNRFLTITFLVFGTGVLQISYAQTKSASIASVAESQEFNIKREILSSPNVIDTTVLPATFKDKEQDITRKEEVMMKESTNSFEKEFSLSKFKNLKIDTGEIPLEKDGLKLRGKQFRNTNHLDFPLATHQKFDQKKLFRESISNTAKQHLPLTNNVEDSKIIKQGKALADKDVGHVNNVKTQINKASSLKNQKGLEKGKAEMLTVKKVYSEKYIKKIKDSLGVQKADSIFKIASPLLKKEVSKEDLLQSINSSLPASSKASNDLGFDPSAESLSNPDQSKMDGLSGQYSGGDVTKMKLPSEVLQELQPLGGKQVNGKYVHLVDSMRNINLNRDRLKLKESNVTDQIKATVVEKKQSFWDKSYGEGVLGILQNRKVTIAQFSPSLGYHFKEYFSIGAGPNFLITAENKKLNTIVGLRCFSKIEFYKRRVYIQVEDNLNSSPVNTETFQRSKQTVLAGGGVLLPITKTIALNPSLMYKVNNGNNLNGLRVFMGV